MSTTAVSRSRTMVTGCPSGRVCMRASGYRPGRPRRPCHQEVFTVPQQAWSKKRERQYEHIKEGLEDRGTGEDKAEEIAARTVNKERARSGEARQRSRTST